MNLIEDYRLIVDLWKLLRHFQPVQKDDPDYWEAVCRYAKELSDRHGGSRFAKDLALAFLNEMERRGR